MPQMYTIFINDSVIYLVDNPININAVSVINFDHINLEDIIERIELGELKSVCIYHENLNGLWKNFKNSFKVIEAAGGLVFNKKNETLWIYRHDKWDLPKGKVEKNEDLEDAALREVKEECGVTDLSLVSAIEKTYHVYRHKGNRILKITHWYKMIADNDQNLRPQIEEHITKVVWMDTDNIQDALENTYDNIKLVCRSSVL